MAPSIFKFGSLSLVLLSNFILSGAASISRRVVLPTGWSYQGCYVDNTNGRIVVNQQPDNQQLTVESCVAACKGAGYSIAAMEYSVQCFCGNYIQNGGFKASADTDCNTNCGGNAQEKCGGGNRMSIYSNGPPKVLAPPSAQKTGLPGSWTYKGCYTDNGQQTGRTLSNQLILSTTNQASACLTQCSAYGYNTGGMEYGTECYCGDSSEPNAVGSVAVAETDCNTPCSGNASYYCGAGNRMSLYSWTGTPLQVFGYPSDINAGQYQNFGNAPIVALITTPGVNGKISMVEKYGTSTTPGSTGAYELDPKTGTFRTMHVKTDVFCSAGLTLPDKAGRQINIGGWSGDSLYGIRLYWPGGPTNDWQENPAELKLQIGRWYPSAMILSNGSIVVVGGEDGSNGPAQPSLEILPRQGGILTMDWLQRTNPFNLYPFLCVLPSGGMFVAYYNEARVLDQRTFATTKTLPNMPGAVNNPLGGRTYPLEGTMVLLPQKAPYTDPLTVLVCGGSTPGPAYPIDNCVSTQPDAANPQWTIEKMPSVRVMSCMTALPDGTYLILNGAHHGVAGFGLAYDANHNAVLYDPSKPINQRMSVMANTTIDRFYHSEAILMPDGRVLVSGSDPQTNGLIQETRLEVFVPPYRLSGKTPPSYVITNKDWTYGSQIKVTVTLPDNGAVRFSLMGAESSTHGQSGGQRTIFPAVSCAGNICTITAPPNAYVCPPGWFQLFLLDGPTPSSSTFVRIGGDPSKLGNWPTYADFDKPGV